MNQKLKQKNKELKIADIKLMSCVSLAPMAGITDVALRELIRRYSKKCLLTTEMISSESLMQNIDHTKILAYRDDETPLAYQISGHKPWMMAKAAKILEDKGGADIIDINMGCPVKKVVTGGDGSALMRTPEIAADIVKAVKDSVSLPVTVKFRLGYTASEKNFMEFAKLMEESGADAMTIHCRTRSQMYAGEADWAEIKDVKNEIKVPVFVNGDIVSPQSAIVALEQSKADGVAIARGVLGQPDLIYRVEHYFETGEMLPEFDTIKKIELMKEHLDLEIQLRGEKNAIQFVRKFYPYYIRGLRNAASYRVQLITENNYDNIVKILDTLKESELANV